MQTAEPQLGCAAIKIYVSRYGVHVVSCTAVLKALSRLLICSRVVATWVYRYIYPQISLPKKNYVMVLLL